MRQALRRMFMSSCNPGQRQPRHRQASAGVPRVILGCLVEHAAPASRHAQGEDVPVDVCTQAGPPHRDAHAPLHAQRGLDVELTRTHSLALPACRNSSYASVSAAPARPRHRIWTGWTSGARMCERTIKLFLGLSGDSVEFQAGPR